MCTMAFFSNVQYSSLMHFCCLLFGDLGFFSVYIFSNYMSLKTACELQHSLLRRTVMSGHHISMLVFFLFSYGLESGLSINIYTYFRQTLPSPVQSSRRQNIIDPTEPTEQNNVCLNCENVQWYSHNLIYHRTPYIDTPQRTHTTTKEKKI